MNTLSDHSTSEHISYDIFKHLLKYSSGAEISEKQVRLEHICQNTFSERALSLFAWPLIIFKSYLHPSNELESLKNQLSLRLLLSGNFAPKDLWSNLNKFIIIDDFANEDFAKIFDSIDGLSNEDLSNKFSGLINGSCNEGLTKNIFDFIYGSFNEELSKNFGGLKDRTVGSKTSNILKRLFFKKSNIQALIFKTLKNFLQVPGR
jgi:hypothetical protein